MSKLDKREQEIVDWLRNDAALTIEQVSKWHKERGLTMRQTFEWESLIALKLGLANAISRLEHRPKSEEKQ